MITFAPVLCSIIFSLAEVCPCCPSPVAECCETITDPCQVDVPVAEWDHVPTGTGWPTYPAATFPPTQRLPGYGGWEWPTSGGGWYGNGGGFTGGGSCWSKCRPKPGPPRPPATVPEPPSSLVFCALILVAFLFYSTCTH